MSVREPGSLSRANGAYLVVDEEEKALFGRSIWFDLACPLALMSTVTQVNRGSIFALRRSTLDCCLNGQRSSTGNLCV